MMNARLIAEGVFQAGGSLTAISDSDLEALKAEARRTSKKRARLCAHPGPEALQQDMVIALAGATYIRPHLHRDRAETFHVVEGLAQLLIFSDDGTVTSRLSLGPPGSGQCFFCRIEAGLFHTLIPEGDWFVVHEATTGPFRPDGSVWAPWSPDESDCATIDTYISQLAGTSGPPPPAR